VRGSSPESPPRGVLAPAGGSALPPLWRRVGAPMFSPAMPRSPIPRPLSATLGWPHLPGTAALSQDRSCLSAAKISVTGRVGRRSMGMESSYSDAEVVPMLLLLSVTTSGRRTPFLLPPSVCLQKSLHDPRGPLILTVDSIKPRAGHPAHLGRHARGVDLAADPSEGSHRPV